MTWPHAQLLKTFRGDHLATLVLVRAAAAAAAGTFWLRPLNLDNLVVDNVSRLWQSRLIAVVVVAVVVFVLLTAVVSVVTSSASIRRFLAFLGLPYGVSLELQDDIRVLLPKISDKPKTSTVARFLVEHYYGIN